MYVKFFIIKVYNVEYEFNYYYGWFIFLVDVFFYIVIESFYFCVKVDNYSIVNLDFY